MSVGSGWLGTRSQTSADVRTVEVVLKGLRLLTLAAALAFLAVYIWVAVRRLAFPFDLEWMEGGSVDHVRKLLAGEGIYGPPSLEFTPYLYPPLYYYVSAAFALVTGLGVWPLRLVSFLSSLGCFALLGMLAWRETGRWSAGVLAAGLFAATYRIGGAWLDLARVDSLFLLLMLAAVWLLRHRRSVPSWAAAGALVALSALTKQTALMMFVPLLVYAVLVDWRKGLVFALSAAGLFGLSTLLLDIAHQGWFVYYVFALPGRIQEVGTEVPNFWRRDIFGAMPIAAAVAGAYLLTGGAQRHRPAAFYAAFAVAAIGSSWAGRAHSGASANVLIPAYACLAVLLALAVSELSSLAAPERQGLLRVFLLALCAIQFVTLIYDPRPLVPTTHDLALQRQLMALIARTDGEVYMPNHGYFPVLAGKEPHAQSWAVNDIVRAGRPQDKDVLLEQFHEAFRQRRFRMVLIDRVPPWLVRDLELYYRRDRRVFGQDGGLWTRTGYRTRPNWIYVPRAEQP